MLARSFACLEMLKLRLRMRPAPKPVDVGHLNRGKPRTTLASFVELDPETTATGLQPLPKTGTNAD